MWVIYYLALFAAYVGFGIMKDKRENEEKGRMRRIAGHIPL